MRPERASRPHPPAGEVRNWLTTQRLSYDADMLTGKGTRRAPGGWMSGPGLQTILLIEDDRELAGVVGA